MYEFTDKEIKNKFKETEYGKKVNQWLYWALTVTFSFFMVGVILVVLYATKVLYLSEYDFTLVMGYIGTFFFIAVITMCYFDGKRDGAIEQFKRTLK